MISLTSGTLPTKPTGVPTGFSTNRKSRGSTIILSAFAAWRNSASVMGTKPQLRSQQRL